MQFDEKKAIEIIEKYKLDEKTAKVWKTRGKIPDKYADPEYKTEKQITSNADKVVADRVLTAINSEEINSSVIATLAGVTNLADIQRCKSTLTEEQLIAIKREINRLKIDIKNAIDKELQLKKMIFDKRIKYYPVLRYCLTDSEIKRLVWQVQNSFIEKDIMRRAKDAFIAFLFKLNM